MNLLSLMVGLVALMIFPAHETVVAGVSSAGRKHSVEMNASTTAVAD
jgi:hypothetical protein